MERINHNDLNEMINTNEDFHLINVLSHESFLKEHIPESINIPVSEDNFTEQVHKEVGSNDKKIVVYCASFECDASPKAARKLEDVGFTNVFDFEGGLKEWRENGHPVTGGEAPRASA